MDYAMLNKLKEEAARCDARRLAIEALIVLYAGLPNPSPNRKSPPAAAIKPSNNGHGPKAGLKFRVRPTGAVTKACIEAIGARSAETFSTEDVIARIAGSLGGENPRLRSAVWSSIRYLRSKGYIEPDTTLGKPGTFRRLPTFPKLAGNDAVENRYSVEDRYKRFKADLATEKEGAE